MPFPDLRNARNIFDNDVSNFKKSPCRLSLECRCRMSNIYYKKSLSHHVKFKNWPCCPVDFRGPPYNHSPGL